jgi:serine/threonine protein kinase/Tol biopolymer transport system component
MSPERWRQIEQVYHATLERAPGHRASYLAEACAGDDSLRKEIESLLARDASDPQALLNHPATPHLASGARLGPYEIESQLGAGGMGEVWKAHDTRLGRTVALKFSKTGFGQRFEREARAVAALNHPHIATLYDIGPNYFVMEYVDGRPLQQLIPRKGLSLAQSLHYAVQIADALAAAHAAGIVHRDLKPGNIMITPAGQVKVVDFGLAHVATPPKRGPEDPTFTQTAEGTIAGTVSYMSPEQAQGKAVDARSDIFSFGAVLYEMLTGARAFQGDSSVAIISEILSKEPRPAGDVPRDVERLLCRCLRKDPARRWQNSSDLKVALLELKEDSESGKLNAVLPVSGKRRLASIWFAAAAVVALAAAAGWYFTRSHQPAGAAAIPVPLTSYPGVQVEPSFSPDGNQVAFAWNGPQRDNWDIYVKVVGVGEPLRLTSDPAGDRSPAWSPDGRWIAFARTLPGNRYALMLIPPLGGSERRLGDFGAPEWSSPGFAWTQDSKHLVIPIREPSRRNGLFLLSLDTGELRQLTSVGDHSSGEVTSALSPDGRILAFLRDRDNSLGDLYTLNLSSDFSPAGAPRLLVAAISSGLAWTADGKEVLFSAGPPYATVLKRVAVSGNSPPQPVSSMGDFAGDPAVSRPAGGPSRLAWVHRFFDSNIYRLELFGNAEKAGSRQPLIASSFRDVFPQYSPDGKSIVFYSSRSGTHEIWICQADGSAPRQLTTLGAHTTASPRWSPDGRQVAFDSNKEGIYEVYVVNAEGGSPKRLTDPPSTSFTANWSPDGRWLYFASDRTGSLNIWKMPASGGPAAQVTKNGGSAPAVSPDGKFLYYTKGITGTVSSLWRVALEGGNEAQLVPIIYRYSYAVTGHGIYFAVPVHSGTGGTLEFLDPDSGKRSMIAHVDRNLDLGMTVSPDGRYLLYPQVDYQGANLMMIETFR